MSQQFLHHFEFCPDTPQKSRVSMPECVPSESFLNSSPLRNGTNISAQDRLAPDRLAATVPSACKNPILWFVETADVSIRRVSPRRLDELVPASGMIQSCKVRPPHTR